MDVAMLGVGMDSSGLKQGILTLDQVSTSAKHAEAATRALTAATKNASSAALASARAAYQESVAKTAAARASENASKADVQGAMAAQRKAKAALEAAKAAHANITASEAAANAAKKAATAFDQEAAAAKRAADAMRRPPGAVPLVGGGGGVNPWGDPSNDNAGNVARGMNRFNTANIAAQFQDIAVSAQMGMGPLQVALQQGTQLAAVLNSMESPVKGLAAAFTQVLNPVSMITIGLIALATAGLQMVDWVSVGKSVLNGMADVLEAIAPYGAAFAIALQGIASVLGDVFGAVGKLLPDLGGGKGLSGLLESVGVFAGVAATGLALLYAPAVLGGIKALTLGILGAAKAAGVAALAFAAANPAVAFVLGISAAVAAANLFRDELAAIFGRDIVNDAKKAVNWVIGAFVGGYDAIKATWSMLPSALGDLVYQGVDATIGAVEKMINFVGQKVNTFIDKIEGIINTVSGWIGMGGVELNRFTDIKFDRPTNPYEGSAARALEAAKGAVSGAMETDYVGGAYDLIAKGASAASEKLRELAGSLGEAEKAKKRAKTEAEKLAERYNDILLDAEGFIAAQMAERDALLLTEEAANALRYEQELLNKAMQAGITIDAEKAAELKSYAAAMAGAEAETSRFRDAINFAKDVTKGFVSDLRSGLEQGKGFWRSFADAALNALDRVVDKLLNDVIDALFRVNKTASGMGGGGGLFGFLGGLFGGGGGSSPYLAFSQTGQYLFDSGGHLGSNVIPFGPNTRKLGDRILADSGFGPQHFPAVLKKGESVLTADHMRRTINTINGLAANRNHANQNAQPVYNDNRVYNFTGTSEEFQQFKEYVAQRDAQFDERAVTAVKGYYGAGNNI